MFIFSHASGAMPFLTERLPRLFLANKNLESRVPNGVMYERGKFKYDVAPSAHPVVLASLLKLVPVSRGLFGTDFPFRTSVDHIRGLTDDGFSASDLQAIAREKAVRPLPRLTT